MIEKWKPSASMRNALVNDGWLTPNTYCNFFDVPGDFPAVYLFSIRKSDEFISPDFDKYLIAYVGMSTRLSERLSGHPVKRELRDANYYVMTWFKRIDAEKLRDVESELILKFDPPWNIVGRVRGILNA